MVAFLKTLVHFDQQQSVHCFREVDAKLLSHVKHLEPRSRVMTVMGELSKGCINLSRPRKAHFIRTGFGCLFPALGASAATFACQTALHVPDGSMGF